jgi:predicted DNA-binding protein
MIYWTHLIAQLRRQDMTRVIELTEEQYHTLEQAAAERGRTPDVLLAELIEDLRDRDREPHYFETEDWFRHLGATEEQIAESAKIAQERGREPRDADA